MIQVGQQAPDFSEEAVINGDFKKISLSDYKGKWLVLFFYPLDFTFVCPTEITAFSNSIDGFKKLGAEVVGVSVDSKYSHLAWTQQPRDKGGLGDIKYPLLQDLTKKISEDYGVLLSAGVALRGLFVIDPEGTLQYQVVHNLNFGRNVKEVLRVIEALKFSKKSGDVCPANWEPGSQSMKPDPKGSQEYFSKAK